MTPPEIPAAHVRAYYRHRLARATAGYREAFADVLTHRRLEAEARARLSSNGPELAILREGLREIVQIRLLGAYAPILQTLGRIERQIAVISRWRAETWAPPAGIPPTPPMSTAELPLILRRETWPLE